MESGGLLAAHSVISDEVILHLKYLLTLETTSNMTEVFLPIPERQDVPVSPKIHDNIWSASYNVLIISAGAAGSTLAHAFFAADMKCNRVSQMCLLELFHAEFICKTPHQCIVSVTCQLDICRGSGYTGGDGICRLLLLTFSSHREDK